MNITTTVVFGDHDPVADAVTARCVDFGHSEHIAMFELDGAVRVQAASVDQLLEVLDVARIKVVEAHQAWLATQPPVDDAVEQF